MDPPSKSEAFPIREQNPNVYPSTWETKTTDNDLKFLKTYTNDEFKRSSNLAAYLSDFHKNPGKYDLHETNFQDWALETTQHSTVDQLRKFSTHEDHAYKRILRARVYAICSRDTLGWDGTALTKEAEKKQKKAELKAIWGSCVLYDWCLYPKKFVVTREPFGNCKIVVSPSDTQSTVERLATQFPGKKIAWLNLANAHNCLGTYNVNFGGSQEEEVAPNTTAAATLGLHADTLKASAHVRGIISGEDHIQYREGRHIPPGGNYFCHTRFITSEPQIDCYMIASAFADFRSYIPFARPWSEKGFYYDWKGDISDEAAFDKRLSIDIEGVFKTAVLNEITVLILGASGCGAFLHDPKREARLWKKYTDEWGKYFEHIEFAILPDKNRPENVTAFQDQFPTQK